jgi:hypothetical protein
MAETYGHTLGIKVPGVAAIARSVEEAANDYAKGYVWQDMATLSGGNRWLSRKSLGGNGWIYCAPDGSRWRVQMMGVAPGTAYSITVPLNFTLRLSRFGELLGASEVRNYSMSISTFGKNNGGGWPGSTTTAYFLVANCNRDGSRAILELARFSNAATGARALEQRQVFAFHEFVLTGTPGIDFSPSLSLIIPASGVIVQTRNDTMRQSWFAGWTASGDPWYSASVLPSPVRAVVQAPKAALSEGESTGYKVCSVWYDDDGLPVPVKLMIEMNMTLDHPDPTPVHVSSSTWTVDAWLQWGDIQTTPVRISGHSAAEWNYPNPYISAEPFAGSVVTNYVFDYDFSLSNRVSTTSYGPSDLSSLGLVGAALPVPAVEPYSGTLMGFYVARLSNNVLSVMHLTDVGGTTGDSYRYVFAPLVPSGPLTGSPLITMTTHNIRYGSHNPATGETTWGGTVPVCYV